MSVASALEKLSRGRRLVQEAEDELRAEQGQAAKSPEGFPKVTSLHRERARRNLARRGFLK